MDDRTFMANETTTPPRKAAFVQNGKAREQVVELEWPIEFDGKVYDKITIHRMTADEMANFVSQAKENPETRLPMYDVPFEVIEALDPDDAENVAKITESFLPRVLR